MVEVFGRWPLWYWLLVAYTTVLGIRGAWDYAHLTHALRDAELQARDDLERSRLRGQRAGAGFRVGSWLVGSLLLLTGWNWVRVLVAIAYARSAIKTFRQYATGFAEGRKAASLAAAPEYVSGRVAPRMPDHFAAGLFVVVTRV